MTRALHDELMALDRNLMALKRTAKEQHGSSKAKWPNEVRAEIFEKTERAKELRRTLGLRD